MGKTPSSFYTVDNSSLLYLALIRKDHTNIYRFTMTLTDTVCPEALQAAVDRVYRRFPTIIAGFYPGFFHYLQVPAKTPPQVQPDPGCLITMSREEITRCAYRVYYRDNTISIEAFHALTDGYGAIASLTTLISEYLRLKYDIHIPVEKTVRNVSEEPAEFEVADSYMEYHAGKPILIPNRYSYQLPGGMPDGRGVHFSRQFVSVNALMNASRRYGVSMTALLSGVMADSIMELQQTHTGGNALPVRIMVPIDLRRIFPSRTLRNFILYALPTLEPQDHGRPLREILESFKQQLHSQIERSRLASIMAYHANAQHNWLFRHIPLSVKCAFMRIAYRFCGEVNSSITFTNLGNLQLPEEMAPFVTDIDVILTPRRRSPYNCAVISYDGRMNINISRFSREPELETVFFRKLSAILQECTQ